MLLSVRVFLFCLPHIGRPLWINVVVIVVVVIIIIVLISFSPANTRCPLHPVSVFQEIINEIKNRKILLIMMSPMTHNGQT